MKHPFVHLHVHSEYSLLDGAIRCADLARRTAEFQSPAVALTDHGAMYGTVEFYEKCREKNIKPIIGCEVYVDPQGHTCRDKRGRNHHLLLLAENQEGYHNLVKLVSIANTDGFYFKPRIDHELLARYARGLIGSSACLAGEIPSLLLEGDEEGACERASLYRDILGEGNFYLELMHNALSEQALANKGLLRVSERTGIPIIATNDAHYLNAADASWHEVLLCVQTNSTINDPGRYRFGASDFYLRSPEEMWTLFGDELPHALTNTVEIAERCSVSFVFGQYQLPHFSLPEGETLESHLERVAREGLLSRFPEGTGAEYEKRLEYELGVINQMGFAGYFLIVADFINAAKERGIPVGPGRGSAAGSLVAYALRITELDPIRYTLLFERFLNPERISMPDIDTDISDKRRDEVLEYVVQKYGRENVSQIITFDRMKSKAAVKDVARALAIPYAEADKVAKLIPDGVKSIAEAVEKSPDLAALRKADSAVANLLDVAGSIEGLARHCSQHAAGVVIAPTAITDIVPVRRIGNDQVVTQFAMEPVEKLGLVKMDFLGLRTLSLIEDTLANIASNGKTVPDVNRLPLDDAATFRLLQTADTMGIFQLESGGMRQLLKRLKPDTFEDIIAVLALYRPGPLESGMVDQYIKRKHGQAPVEYLHPRLAEVLKETYGVILYQEQVMKIASELAGFSLGEADLLRRAMGKKKEDVMLQQKGAFVEGCAAQGVSREKAEEIFDIILVFAGYGFNKSHSAAYALISYQTAYLKAHYRAEFLAAFLSSQIGSKMDVLARYVRAVRESGVQVSPPHVNESGANFTVVDEVIRFGLSAVARVGDTAVEAILTARRKEGPFRSLWDFCNRVDLRVVNRSIIENLVKAGAFDGLGGNRRQFLQVLEEFIRHVQAQEKQGAQRSLFEIAPEDEPPEEPPLPELDEYSRNELLEFEKETLGLYLSGHPLEQQMARFLRYATCTIEDLAHWTSPDVPATVGGVVVAAQEKYTKRGDPMGVLEIEDTNAKIEVVCFPKTWMKAKALAVSGNYVLVLGKIQDRGGLNLLADEILLLDQTERERAPWMRLRVDSFGLDATRIRDLVRELKGNPGPNPVLLEIAEQGRSTLIRLKDVKVAAQEPFATRLSEMLNGAVEVHV
ncbi:DNA polymerase III subunit alpha [Aminiphilus sp.]|uniref:DNA polymerase III subunit alpha n=1 Tax=Aminiphilus sp. TaxID=1872488 RepID=UPI002627CEE2|nr:DNA polymerase III subunit alpha [Aminiphilus sp.]